MANPFTLSILGGSLILATAAGVHLGESAVGLINPIHFQGPALHPRERGVAIDETDLPQPTRVAYRDLYGWDEGRAARAEDCGNCDALRARDAFAYSAVVPYFGGPAERRPGPAVEGPQYGEAEQAVAFQDQDQDQAQDWDQGRGQDRGRDVERYAHYPVAAVAEEEIEKPEFDTADETW